MLPELAYATDVVRATYPGLLTSKELLEMATVNPAQLAGFGDRLGRVAPGYAADLVVVSTSAAGDAELYRALLFRKPTDVRLILVGGRPLFGDAALMRTLAPSRPLERITVCGAERLLAAQEGTYAHVPLSATTNRLREALARHHSALAPLVECE
jgi:hypothetical protein